MFEKQKVCFIGAEMKGDYCAEGIRQLGYRFITPYKDYNLLLRCMREAWFRLKLPGRSRWYNPKCAIEQAELFVVRDSLMSAEYLQWLRKKHPQARIVLEYENMVAKTMNPDTVTDTSIEKYTYDAGDAKQYGMKMRKQVEGYYDSWVCHKTVPPVYDIVYVGRDKGRAQQLFVFENKLKELGQKTYFHICPDRRFLRWKKSYYKPLLNYRQYLALMGKTKAILNIVQSGAKSITMREIEGAFHTVKCITDNPYIKNFWLYHPSRYFVLGVDPLESLPAFMDMPFVPITEEERDKLRFDRAVESLYLDGVQN